MQGPAGKQVFKVSNILDQELVGRPDSIIRIKIMLPIHRIKMVLYMLGKTRAGQ